MLYIYIHIKLCKKNETHQYIYIYICVCMFKLTPKTRRSKMRFPVRFSIFLHCRNTSPKRANNRMWMGGMYEGCSHSQSAVRVMLHVGARNLVNLAYECFILYLLYLISLYCYKTRCKAMTFLALNPNAGRPE